MTNLFKHSNFSVWMNCPTCARRLGDSGVFLFTVAPPDFSTSSNCALNFASLSRITYPGASAMSSVIIRKFRACRLTYAESGCTVLGEIQARRLPRCRNTSRYTSTSPFAVQIGLDRKSHSQSVSASILRNSSHCRPARKQLSQLDAMHELPDASDSFFLRDSRANSVAPNVCK